MSNKLTRLFQKENTVDNDTKNLFKSLLENQNTMMEHQRVLMAENAELKKAITPEPSKAVELAKGIFTTTFFGTKAAINGIIDMGARGIDTASKNIQHEQIVSEVRKGIYKTYAAEAEAKVAEAEAALEAAGFGKN